MSAKEWMAHRTGWCNVIWIRCSHRIASMLSALLRGCPLGDCAAYTANLVVPSASGLKVCWKCMKHGLNDYEE